MSHFALLVITQDKPSEKELHEILLPWHEYECTGYEEYTQNIDITDEVTEDYNQPRQVVVTKDGLVFSRWDNRFYEDGRFVLPEGAMEHEMPAIEARLHGVGHMTLDDCAREFGAVRHADGRYYRKTNPNRKWDWWQIGGRWTGLMDPDYNPEKDPRNQEFCTICQGTGRRPVHKLTADTWEKCNACKNGIRTKWPTEWVKVSSDQMMIKDIPIDHIRDMAMKNAAEIYDKVHKVLKGRIIESFETIVSRHTGDYETARKVYWDQPGMREVSKECGVWDLERFMVTREQYIEDARKGVLVTHSVVKDGKWYEKGKMGWWGISIDEKDKDQWIEEFSKLIDNLPPTTWLTVVDCHI